MSRKARKNVGLIGLGIIGARVAAGLRAAGYQVYVWNRSAKPAPNFLGSPAEVAESADIIQIFVADADALFQVIEAMSDALAPRHVILCNSTVGPEAVLEAAQMVEARGAQFLDAPFTGSKLAAEKRQLVYYIGGADAAFLRAKPVLEVTSKAILRIGAIGHASTVKVVTNMISAVTVQTLAEALCIVQKAGLEPEMLAAAIEQNACRSGVIDLKLPKMIAGDYEPHFSLKHMFKDVQLGVHMANALDVDIPVSTVAAGVMYGAINKGWGDLDFSVLFQNYTDPEPREALPALAAGQAADTMAQEPGEGEATPQALTPPAEETASEMPETGLPIAGFAPPMLRSLDSLVGSADESPAPVAVEEPGADNSGEMLEEEPADKIIEEVRTFDSDTPAGEERGEQETQEQPAEQPVAAAAKPIEAKIVTPTPLSKHAKASADAAAAALAENPETTAAPGNFVRRWFVARPGG